MIRNTLRMALCGASPVVAVLIMMAGAVMFGVVIPMCIAACWDWRGRPLTNSGRTYVLEADATSRARICSHTTGAGVTEKSLQLVPLVPDDPEAAKLTISRLFGVPARSLRYEEKTSLTLETVLSGPSESWCGSASFKVGSRLLRIPTHPQSVGLAINTIVGASLAGLGWIFTRTLRCARRLNEGLCPYCCHPLCAEPGVDRNVCVECGRTAGDWGTMNRGRGTPRL